MKTKIAEKCLDIIDGILVNGNIDSIKYIVEALRQDIDKNKFRRQAIELKLSERRRR